MASNRHLHLILLTRRCVRSRARALRVLDISPRVILKFVQLWTMRRLPPPQKIGYVLEPPRQHSEKLIPRMCAGRDGKDVIQLLESALLSLGHEAEDEEEGDEVHGGVEAECAGGAEGA